MIRKIAVAGALLAVAGCATVPQRKLGTLDQTDPKYHTEECVRARDLALQFDNKVFTRIGTGMALGLLGPFGLPIAIAGDMHQNDMRKQMDDELDRRCHSQPGEVGPAEAMARAAPASSPATHPEPAPSDPAPVRAIAVNQPVTDTPAPASVQPAPQAAAAATRRPRPDAVAYCGDGSFSYTHDDGVVCRGHGGVREWR